MTIEKLRQEVQNAYADSFMKPDISRGDYLEIDGDNGIVTVPMETVETTIELDHDIEWDYEDMGLDQMEEVAGIYQNCVAGHAEPHSVEIKNGYIYRLSANGYMDSTDYHTAETEEEALKNLLEMADAE